MHSAVSRIVDLDLQLYRVYAQPSQLIIIISSAVRSSKFNHQLSMKLTVFGFRYSADLKKIVTSTHDYIRRVKHKILIAYLAYLKKKTMSEQIRHAVTSD